MDPTTYYRYILSARTELWSFVHALPEAELDRIVIQGERFQTMKHLLLHIADVEDYWVHEVIRGTTPILSKWPHDRLHPGAEQYLLAWIYAYTIAVQEATLEYLGSLDDRELQGSFDNRLHNRRTPTASNRFSGRPSPTKSGILRKSLCWGDNSDTLHHG